MVRTRIAPSPTGDPHVGTGYIALFNYCFARKHGGQFLLRIEDTDQKRSTRESEQTILEALQWLGLQWDEGPDVGGPHGPYRQSERSEIYTEHVQTLIDKGHAFRCFCTAERLDTVRAEQRANKQDPRYDGHCLSLSATDSQAKADAGESFVVRMKVPTEGTCVVKDLFRGEIAIEWSTVDMQVLMKSDGLPTYHLANVVDDHLMGITHVFRGEEWISSAPKHLLLYDYFGWDVPVIGHFPLLRNPDKAKSKLSKRKNPTSILYYRRMGYMPEALLNYLGMMAWSMPNEEEKFSLAEMVEAFTMDRVSMGGPVFDIAKLDWLNGRHIREDLDDEQFADRVQEWALNREYMMPLIPMIRQRLDKFSDMGALLWHFFAGEVNVTAEALATKKLDPEQTLQAIQWVSWRLDTLVQWDADMLSNILRDTASLMDVKLRDFLKPFFIAMSGGQVSTPLFDTMAALGPDVSRARLRAAITALGGVGKKKESKLRKALKAAEAAQAAAAAEAAEASAPEGDGA